ncbi:MAG: YitT family protein [Clostridia bacterium]|nr:YitT family protein [Oscillospiraceae bacterium]MBQ3763274.1 YitT family protein [Clostridia bacterium]
MKGWRTARDILVIVFAALLLALSYRIFIFPNEFAPAGLPGFATMLQHQFGFKVGYMTLIYNVPLVFFVYFLVGHEYAIRSAIFALFFSTILLALDCVDLSRFIYHSDHSAILAPIAGGVVSGFCYGIVMKRNSSTGGTDLVAALVHHKWPEHNLLWIIFMINAAVAAVSYFVYDYKIEPVILCVIYCFISSEVSDMMLKGFKEAVKFEIVTDQPEELTQALMEALHHGVTELPAVGGFTHSNKTLLICVVNKRQIVHFQKILARFPGSFAYLSSVKETMGNFTRSK